MHDPIARPIASGLFIIGRINRNNAANTTATTAAAMPRIAGSTCGCEPYAQYSHAIGRMISIAGVMKQIPAANNPGIPAQNQAEMNRQLRRVRPGNEIQRRHQVQKVLSIDPLAAMDDLLLHHRHMHRRAHQML